MKYLICVLFSTVIIGGCLPVEDDTDTDTDTDTDVDTDTDAGTDTDTDTGTESEEDSSCINEVCSNADNKTHTDCACREEGFCIPDLAGIDVFWVPLTCTLDCTDEPGICLEGYHCVEIPAFVGSIYPDTFPGSLCAKDEEEPDTDSDTDEAFELEWVSIPGGVFQMGTDAGRENESPVHTVTVPLFEMLRSEVTVAQYNECIEEGACTEPGGGVNATWPIRTNHPVNYVSWFQATDFCEWAGGHLPSEAQWEYAATNCGDPILYPWGDSVATCATTVIFENGDGCGTGSTMPVCSKHDGNTDQGLCDMHGNVWEWIQDWYHPSYIGAPDDGAPWESPAGIVRITRGGAFSYDGTYTVKYRNDHADPTIQFQSDGFRCSK